MIETSFFGDKKIPFSEVFAVSFGEGMRLKVLHVSPEDSQLSINKKIPSCWGYIGDSEILHSYMGTIILNHDKGP